MSNFQVFNPVMGSSTTMSGTCIVTNVQNISSDTTLPNNDAPIAIYLLLANNLTINMPNAFNNKTMYFFTSVGGSWSTTFVPYSGQSIFGSSSPQTVTISASVYLISTGVNNYVYMGP